MIPDRPKNISQIVLASNNPGKITEFKSMFATVGIDIIPQSLFNVPEIDEPYNTFIENSLHKARHCSKHTGLPALADDSGLCVNSLNGAPGVFSARFAGNAKNDQENINKLINELDGIADKSAYYYTCLVLMNNQNDPAPIITTGKLHGTIIDQPRGKNGFGYDPIFYLPQYCQTTAELDINIKNQISHRAMALNELLSYF